MNPVFSPVVHLARVMPRHANTAISLNVLKPQSRRAKSSLSYQVAAERAKIPEEPKPKASPLSVLPASALLRSFLVATISSKPYLLRPTVAFLSWLTRSSGGVFWNVDRNPVLRACLKSTFYKQFCAGESTAEARENVQRLRALGYRGTMLQNAKETLFDFNSKKAHSPGIASAADGDPSRCRSIAAWNRETLGTARVLEEGDLLAFKYVCIGIDSLGFIADRILYAG